MHYYTNIQLQKSIRETNMTKIIKKMTLKSYYESLEREVPPKTALIKELADECNVNEATVRNWILYGIKPREEKYKEIISKKTNIPIEELW